jgi:hypothetical protein
LRNLSNICLQPFSRKFAPCLALTLLSVANPRAHALEDGATQVIAIKGGVMPDLGVSLFNTFSDPVLNGSGTVAFVGKAASSGGSSGVYKSSTTGLVSIAVSGDAAGVIGGTFTGFFSPLISESGLVGFLGSNGQTISPTLPGLLKTGIYSGTGVTPRTLTTIAATGQVLPNLSSAINQFPGVAPGSMALTDAGNFSFVATVADVDDLTTDPTGAFAVPSGGATTTIAATTTTAPVGGQFTSFTGSVLQNNVGMTAFNGTSSGGTAIYTKLGSSPAVTVAATGQSAPGIGGNFSGFAGLALNDQGKVAFTGTSDNAARAIYTGSGGTLSVLASTLVAAPGLTGNFTTFGDIVLSNTGLVAFRGSATGGQGIYIAPGGVAQAVATTGQAAPNIGGTFSSLATPKLALNDLGIVGFIGTNGAGARGIYLGDSQELITAAYMGQPVAGSTITSLTFVGGADRGGSSQMNNNGQIAYAATLANGNTSVLLFTPKLHFRNAAGGTWATRSNWTIGILPASVHDVAIDPVGALTVTGPLLPTTIRSLAVGTGAGLAELALQSSGTITAPGGVTIGTVGKVRGNGRFVGNVTSNGTIAPGLPAAGGSITVTGNLTLQATSQLALELGGLTRKSAYDCLTVSGALTLGGNLNVTLLNGFTPLLGNAFDLFDSASTSGTFAALNLPSLSGGLAWNTSLISTTGVISVVSTGPVNATWNLPGSGSWSNALASNWNPAVPNSSGAVATFGAFITAPATVSVDTAKTVGKVIFNSANSYTVAGGVADVITLADGAGTPEVSVTLGSHSISAPVVLAQDASVSAAVGTTLTISGGITGSGHILTKTGAGTVNLDGPQSYAALISTAGTTTVDGPIGSGTSSASVTGAGSILKFGSVSQTLSSLTIGAGSTVTFTSGAASFGGGDGKSFGGGAVVPEPGSLGLLLTGLLGLLGRRRR